VERAGHGQDLGVLKDAFLASEWAGRKPSHIEIDVEVPLAGTMIRSRIDAVFPIQEGLERVTVVDWKSGRPPQNETERASREVQLAMYRLAWARWNQVQVSDVDAAFFYAATGQTVRPQALASEAELEALLEDAVDSSESAL